MVASQLGEALDLSPSDRRAVYFAALLRSLGCTAHASTFAEMFDDDVVVQRELKTLDLADPAARAAQTSRFATWAGPERARRLVDRFVTELPAQGATLGRGSCEVSAAERYDGHGFPEGRGGDELTVAARVVHVAEQAVMAEYDGGPEAAVERVAGEAGRPLDPDMCAAFVARREPLLARTTSPACTTRSGCEPAPGRRCSPSRTGSFPPPRRSSALSARVPLAPITAPAPAPVRS